MLQRLGKVGRTLRPLRFRQIAGQVWFRLRRGSRRGSPWKGAAPPLAAVKVFAPFLPAPAHALTDGCRRFRLINREVIFSEEIDWDYSGEGPLWAFHLHQFDYARRPGLTQAARRRLIFDWIDNHPAGVGWNSHSTSLRTMTWIKLLVTPDALALSAEEDEEFRASLTSQLRHLVAYRETHIDANHYLSNLLAIVFGGLAFNGVAADQWLVREEELRHQLVEQVGPDGLHYERSPMYHSLLLESVLDLVNLAASVPQRVPQALDCALRETAARMLGALRALTHPDGEIALFSDSALGIAQKPEALEQYAQRLGIVGVAPKVSGVLDVGGYVRLEQGSSCLIASVAGPSPAHQPGHAHGDALAFELSIGSQRVITDSGVYEYIPGSLRDAARATCSHATVEVAGSDQAEFWSSHRVGGRPRVELVSVKPGRRLEATCASWSTPQTLHRRIAELSRGSLTLIDQLEGAPASVRVVFPFAPGLGVELRGNRATVQLSVKRKIQIELAPHLRWHIETTPYFQEFGKREERVSLVGEAETLTDPVKTVFRFTKE